MVSIVTDTTEFAFTGVGSFEYVTDKDVDMNELTQKLASMLIRVQDLRE